MRFFRPVVVEWLGGVCARVWCVLGVVPSPGRDFRGSCSSPPSAWTDCGCDDVMTWPRDVWEWKTFNEIVRGWYPDDDDAKLPQSSRRWYTCVRRRRIPSVPPSPFTTALIYIFVCMRMYPAAEGPNPSHAPDRAHAPSLYPALVGLMTTTYIIIYKLTLGRNELQLEWINGIDGIYNIMFNIDRHFTYEIWITWSFVTVNL